MIFIIVIVITICNIIIVIAIVIKMPPDAPKTPQDVPRCTPMSKSVIILSYVFDRDFLMMLTFTRCALRKIVQQVRVRKDAY